MNDKNNSKSLARNTLFLYLRLLVSMLVTLYTSRVILIYLGIEDYGIYNAVAGVVSLFSIISGSLSTSISRNLTFELGKGNIMKLKELFSMSINVQLLIILIIVILSEVAAVWFLNSKMQIPENRILASNWVLQFAILTFSANLIQVPYNASIISHEKMDTFAYIGILDILLKLIVVFFLKVSPIDKLIFYSMLLGLESLLIFLIYYIYCKHNFVECTYQRCFSKAVFTELFGFATWNFIGSTSSVLRTQGINVLLNLFFGPVVNAARAISVQVNGAVTAFVNNFMTALTPQITKAYAQENYDYLLNCIYKGSKFSYFLLLFMSLPIMFETEYTLKLWLVNIPETTVNFVRFTIIFSLVDTFSRTLINANNATGDIKKYQLVIGSFNLLILPIAYLILKLGAPAESTVLVSVFVSIIILYPRIYFNKKHFPISYWTFTKSVIYPCLVVTIFSCIPPFTIIYYLNSSLLRFFIVLVGCFLSSVLAILMFGCTSSERTFIFNVIKIKLINKYKLYV